MNIVINSIRFDATDSLKGFIDKKISKLEKYFEGITKTEVFLKVIKPEVSVNKHVEIRLHVPNTELFAEKTCDTFEEAIDLSVEALKKQIIKYKEKVKSN